MKKTLLTVLTAAVLATGCVTTGTKTETNTTSTQTITLEQALQKSAETRQKLLEAKEAYQNAKTAAEVVSGTKSTSDVVTDVIKSAVQDKIDSAKQQLADEKAAWEELLGTN